MHCAKMTFPLLLMLAWGHTADADVLSFSAPVALTQAERRVDAVDSGAQLNRVRR